MFAIGTVALIWLAAVPFGPLVCPAVYPAPPNCFEGNREGSALIMTLVVGVVYAVTLLAAVLPGTRRVAMTAGVVLLAVAPFVAYAVVAWSPGFPL
ncbi:hypothetical protein [Microbacterium sp. GCS4]|uniref:hypothetical protein n=1 Tax=Microbacterium sp. GCS4 TaxID=1692239 RepID=UPI00068057BE|nr:hypothetical protein [Microbacterium sp. GCS4]